ncbi:MAG: 16S rRNA (cytidine(1402)-2'-O)-methyltransferase [Candidatus Alcyoniella australis]|nr:16S rRNA (cytidine(1402)-2'-O)-methyltransferase [Candidatus Alcyoniella australis]
MLESKGTLYIVATPLGNRDDITLRAVELLAQADLVCAEDTREAARLFAHHNIKNKLISLYEHNEQQRIEPILERLLQGQRVALISDAGTPGLSDPGYRLIGAALERGIEVRPLPGPAALIAALSASGLPMERFCFTSFLPRKGARRLQRLAQLAVFPGTVVIYESPRRLAQLCGQALPIFGDRRAVLARELTKQHEQFVRSRLSELERLYHDEPPRGEVTLLIAPPEDHELSAEALRPLLLRARRPDEPPSKAASRIAREFGLPRSEVYAILTGQSDSTSEEE